MDRFIVMIVHLKISCLLNLKSSMDRFIDKQSWTYYNLHINLKSSMDRFIVQEITEKDLISLLFKIQYG